MILTGCFVFSKIMCHLFFPMFSFFPFLFFCSHCFFGRRCKVSFLRNQWDTLSSSVSANTLRKLTLQRLPKYRHIISCILADAEIMCLIDVFAEIMCAEIMCLIDVFAEIMCLIDFFSPSFFLFSLFFWQTLQSEFPQCICGDNDTSFISFPPPIFPRYA